MGVGKYSPNLPHRNSGYEFKFNCYGKEPAPYTVGQAYDEKTMFPNYDDEGFDSYGYSSFDSDGNYVGIGDGVDRDGKTEYDYMREHSEYLRSCDEDGLDPDYF